MAKLRLVTENALTDPASVAYGLLAGLFGRRGTGSPVGVVAGSVGDTYTDTAATAGATRWRKTSADAAAGWVPVEGDTGWLEVTPDPGAATNHPNLRVFVRRVNSLVEARVAESSPAGSGAGVTALYALPEGFRHAGAPAVATGTTMNAATGAGAGNLYVTTAYVLSLHRAGGVQHSGSIMWTTTDPWPAVLPGTPA